MLHAPIIAIVGVIALHDGYPGAFGAPHDPNPDAFAPVLGASLVIALALSAFAHSAVWVCARRLDRTGAAGAVRTAERAVRIARVAAVFVYAWLVLRVGFLDMARAAIGDWVLLDEAVVVAPTLLVFVLGWWSMHPIDRRLHEAGLFARLDEGRPISPMPSRGAYVLDRVRHDLLLLLAPIALILAWSESVVFLLGFAGDAVPGAQPDWRYYAAPWLQLIGAIVILALAPLFIRFIWRTQRIGAGAIRARLTDLCERQGVRFRDILVWKTHGLLINGAVLGIWSPIRYVLLTDALLESLPDDQIEAVMAHELGHVRRRHMPWLLAALLVGLGVTSLILTLVAQGALWALRELEIPTGPIATIFEIGTLIAAVVFGLLVFGFVSRRFERQADAFAVQHLSGLTRRNEPGAGLVCAPESADAMAGALDSVSRLNHLSPTRWTWRHGSIAGRQHAIGFLIGRPVDALPIDRECRRIKGWLTIGFIVMGALSALTLWAQGALG